MIGFVTYDLPPMPLLQFTNTTTETTSGRPRRSHSTPRRVISSTMIDKSMLLPVQWEPRWANVLAFRAQSIGSLTRGWDGPGSVAINRRLLFEAVRIVEKALIGARNAVAPYLVPGGDGSLQIEWHEKDGELEYDLSVEGSRSIWIRDHRTGEQIEGDDDRADALFSRCAPAGVGQRR